MPEHDERSHRVDRHVERRLREASRSTAQPVDGPARPCPSAPQTSSRLSIAPRPNTSVCPDGATSTAGTHASDLAPSSAVKSNGPNCLTETHPSHRWSPTPFPRTASLTRRACSRDRRRGTLAPPPMSPSGRLTESGARPGVNHVSATPKCSPRRPACDQTGSRRFRGLILISRPPRPHPPNPIAVPPLPAVAVDPIQEDLKLAGGADREAQRETTPEPASPTSQLGPRGRPTRPRVCPRPRRGRDSSPARRRETPRTRRHHGGADASRARDPTAWRGRMVHSKGPWLVRRLKDVIC